MENILKEINLEIKKIAQSEEIDTQRLTELISMRDRLKGYNITNISQVQGFNAEPLPAYNVLGNVRQNQGNMFTDSLIDMANLYFKNEVKTIDEKKVHELISYHIFISKLEPSADEETNTERLETKNDIEFLIMKEFKNIINERKNKEKDKIIEVQT